MHIAVAIVGFRNPEDVWRCLAALDHSAHRDFEVVICENGGPAAYAALEDRLPTALSMGQPVRAILADRNLGYAGGVNVCMAAAPDADGCWILNPDTEPEPGALASLVARLEVGDCEAAGCLVYLPNGRVQSYGGRWQGWLARAESIGYGAELDAPVDRQTIERRQNYLNGASLIVSARFLRTVGPMREDYFLYCEEVEWCLRAVKKGLRLGFARDARVLHYQGTTMGNFSDLKRRGRLSIYLSERNKILLTRDCFPLAVFAVAFFAAPFLIYRYGSRGAWRQCGYGLAGWWAGVRGERGNPDSAVAAP